MYDTNSLPFVVKSANQDCDPIPKRRGGDQ